jgi:hypothetical protein
MWLLVENVLKGMEACRASSRQVLELSESSRMLGTYMMPTESHIDLKEYQTISRDPVKSDPAVNMTDISQSRRFVEK